MNNKNHNLLHVKNVINEKEENNLTVGPVSRNQESLQLISMTLI